MLSLLYDALQHCPSPYAFSVLIPLFIQTLLLFPHQTPTLRLLRIALIPLGVICAYQAIRYDFKPREAFRPYNFIKNLIFPIGVAKTLEYGLVKHRFSWLGYERARRPRRGNRVVDGKLRQDAESFRIFSLPALEYSLSLLTR